MEEISGGDWLRSVVERDMREIRQKTDQVLEKVAGLEKNMASVETKVEIFQDSVKEISDLKDKISKFSGCQPEGHEKRLRGLEKDVAEAKGVARERGAWAGAVTSLVIALMAALLLRSLQ